MDQCRQSDSQIELATVILQPSAPNDVKLEQLPSGTALGVVKVVTTKQNGVFRRA